MTRGNRRDLAYLLKIAIEAQKRAYAPYSHHRVGVALLAKSGKVFVGSNSEVLDALRTHAERLAIDTAILAGEKRIEVLVVVSDDARGPCSNCSRAYRRFASSDSAVVIGTPDGVIRKVKSVKELSFRSVRLK